MSAAVPDGEEVEILDDDLSHQVPVSALERMAKAREENAAVNKAMEENMSLLTSNHQRVMNEVMKIGVLEARVISIESASSKMPQGSSQGDAAMQMQFTTFAESIKRDMGTMKVEVKAASTAESVGSAGSASRPVKISRASSSVPTARMSADDELMFAVGGSADFFSPCWLLRGWPTLSI
ncbi:unnamed protein product [Prorocentrum cordatum]|uniref:Uncharacterized protein n=1 Tax=Prorocentrum cordatum TaxID=2364126 RepID=A0ABN9YEA1_9DINO|nr:unnamed protein product [Polarella glacialis]